jgi:hypothetical protein
MAAMLWLIYRRRDYHFAEHFVFCLHYQSFGILVTLPVQSIGIHVLTYALLPITWGYLLLSARRVYGDGWWGTTWRVILGFVGSSLAVSLMGNVVIFYSLFG